MTSTLRAGKKPARSRAASSTPVSFADMPSRSQMRDKDWRLIVVAKPLDRGDYLVGAICGKCLPVNVEESSLTTTTRQRARILEGMRKERSRNKAPPRSSPAGDALDPPAADLLAPPPLVGLARLRCVRDTCVASEAATSFPSAAFSGSSRGACGNRSPSMTPRSDAVTMKKDPRASALREILNLPLQLGHSQTVALQQHERSKAAGKRAIAMGLVPPLGMKRQRSLGRPNRQNPGLVAARAGRQSVEAANMGARHDLTRRVPERLPIRLEIDKLRIPATKVAERDLPGGLQRLAFHFVRSTLSAATRRMTSL
jgi:hypothetical protein